MDNADHSFDSLTQLRRGFAYLPFLIKTNGYMGHSGTRNRMMWTVDVYFHPLHVKCLKCSNTYSWAMYDGTAKCRLPRFDQ